jgi:hypothetical protein
VRRKSVVLERRLEANESKGMSKYKQTKYPQRLTENALRFFAFVDQGLEIKTATKLSL